MENISQLSNRDREFQKLQADFQAFKEEADTRIKEQLNQIQDLEQTAKLRDAFGQFQFKNVTFNGTAHGDTEITHDLSPADPETVRFIPVMWEFLTLPVDPPYIYRPGAANRKSWGDGYIILRCNIASAVVRMLLCTESTEI